MHLFLRFSLCVWAAVTLVSCAAANSAATTLMSPLGVISRTLGSVGRMAGGSAAVEDPDATSNSIAERGKIIEQRGEYVAPEVPQTTSVVAQR